MKVWRILCATSVVFACSATPAVAPIRVVTETRDIIKGTADKCEYALVDLPNGVRAILVHNPEASHEVVSAEVDAGAEHERVPGTAHLLEHALFMGTEKYPGCAEHKEFISKCGGDINAFTAMINTKFMYLMPATIDEGNLDEALDRLSQFFIAPLFLEERVLAEINAVESEFQMMKKADQSRVIQIMLNHMNPDHPHNRFASGNKVALQRDGILAEVVEFYRKHYVPQSIIVAVQTSRSIEKVREVVVEKFGVIGGGKTAEMVPRITDVPLRLPDAFLQIYWIKSVQNLTLINIIYTLPASSHSVDKKPHVYLTRMLSQMAEGSLFALLKQQDLIKTLSPQYIYNHEYEYGEFVISVGMPENGLSNSGRVIATVLAYMEMLRKEPVNEAILREVQSMQELHFSTYSSSDINKVEKIIAMPEKMKNYGFRKMISSDYLIEEVDAEAVKAFGELFQDNFHIIVLDPNFKGFYDEQGEKAEVLEEEWYGTQYKRFRYTKDPALVDKMKKKLGSVLFPPANEFIATQLDIKCTEPWAGKSPTLVVDSPTNKLWYRMDDLFMTPQVMLGFVFRGDYRLGGVKNDLMLEILCRYVNYIMLKEMYLGLYAGYSAHMAKSLRLSNGLRIEVSGYDEHIQKAVLEVMKRVTCSKFDRDLVDAIKQGCKTDFVRSKKMIAKDRAMSWMDYCQNEAMYTVDEGLEHIDSITNNDIEGCARDFFGSTVMETLAYGNLYLHEAQAIHEQAVETISRRYPRTQAFRFGWEHVNLAEESTPLFYLKTEGNESCVCLYIETCKHEDIRGVLMNSLFNQLTKASFFGDLRSVQQLGYIVEQSTARDGCVNMVAYLVQSERPVAELYSKIVEFIDCKSRKIVEGVSEAAFCEYKKAIQESLLGKSKMRDHFNVMMKEIIYETHDFENEKAGAEIIESFTKQDVLNFIDEKIIKRKNIVVAIISEDRYEDDLGKLRSMTDASVELVYLDKETIAAWRDRQASQHKKESERTNAPVAAHSDAAFMSRREALWHANLSKGKQWWRSFVPL